MNKGELLEQALNMSEPRIFLADINQPKGPYSLDEIKSSLAAKQISLDHLAWSEGMSGWGKLSSIPAVQSLTTVVPPSLQYASFGRRAGGYVVDWIIVMPFSIGFSSADMPGGGIVFWWLYSAILESSRLQGTFGKIVFRTRVTSDNYGRISFGRATKRFFTKIVSCIILFIGCLSMLWNPQSQTMHDKAAKTLVVRR